MPNVDIGAETYQAYADVDFADVWLGADMVRAVEWTAASPDNKGRCLVSATRLLAQLSYEAGQPDVANPPLALKEACAMLAGDILISPDTQTAPSGDQSIKRVKAGSAEVEFFRQDAAAPLPSSVWQHLVASGLMGDLTAATDAPFVSGACEDSRFRYDQAYD